MFARISMWLMIAAVGAVCSCAPAQGDLQDGADAASPSAEVGARPMTILVTPKQMLRQKVYSYDHISATAERVRLVGEPFAEALRIVLADMPDNFWEVQTIVPNYSAVAEGDVLMAEFYVRAVETEDESGQVLLSVYFEDAGPPWDKSLLHHAKADGRWRHYLLPFEAKRDYAVGKALFCFGLGHARQTLELAGVRLVNYGSDVALVDLPCKDGTLLARD